MSTPPSLLRARVSSDLPPLHLRQQQQQSPTLMLSQHLLQRLQHLQLLLQGPVMLERGAKKTKNEAKKERGL
jgi:hypothetical protein